MTINEAAPLANVPPTAPAFENIDSDEMKIQRLMLWMEEQGATFPSVGIRVGQGKREAYATAPIKAGALVMHIPRSLMITTDVARNSEIGKLIGPSRSGIGNFGYLAAHLLDLKRQGGFWKSYLDILPKEHPEHPLFFPESELQHLKGAYALANVRSRREWADHEYRELSAVIPPERIFTREEYYWARCTIMTRVHSALIYGHSNSAMVPLADMPNHSSDENVSWRTESTLGFVYIAKHNIEAGEPLTITYGRKCNGHMFFTYGFTLERNAKNVAEIELPPLPPDHPYLEYGRNLGKASNEMRAFQVSTDYDSDEAREMFTYLRLYALTESSSAVPEKKESDPAKVGPISRENEQAALTVLAAACQRRLQQFETTIEEDEALLKDDSLSVNMRNMVRVRHDEKVVVRHFLDLAETAKAVLQATIPAQKFVAYFDNTAKLLWK